MPVDGDVGGRRSASRRGRGRCCRPGACRRSARCRVRSVRLPAASTRGVSSWWVPVPVDGGDRRRSSSRAAVDAPLACARASRRRGAVSGTVTRAPAASWSSAATSCWPGCVESIRTEWSTHVGPVPATLSWARCVKRCVPLPMTARCRRRRRRARACRSRPCTPTGRRRRAPVSGTSTVPAGDARLPRARRRRSCPAVRERRTDGRSVSVGQHARRRRPAAGSGQEREGEQTTNMRIRGFTPRLSAGRFRPAVRRVSRADAREDAHGLRVEVGAGAARDLLDAPPRASTTPGRGARARARRRRRRGARAAPRSGIASPARPAG